MKVNVCGNAVALKSSLKMEDLERVKKYRPEALVVHSDDEEKVPVFICAVAPGSMGDVSDDMIVFGQQTFDGNAVVTKLIEHMPESQEELKEMLADKIGPAMGYMARLEEELPQIIEAINAEREAIMADIEVE